MKNVYLIYGEEEYLKKLNKIIGESGVTNDNIITYNLDEVDVENAIEEVCTVSMFDSNKVIICEKSSFLTGDNKKEINHGIDALIKYINNPFDDVYLIFIVRNAKLDLDIKTGEIDKNFGFEMFLLDI